MLPEFFADTGATARRNAQARQLGFQRIGDLEISGARPSQPGCHATHGVTARARMAREPDFRGQTFRGQNENGAEAPLHETLYETASDPRGDAARQLQTENDEPQPQVLCALGFLITNWAPSRPSW